MEKYRKQQVREKSTSTCGKKALQTWSIMNAIFNTVTSLVEAWKPACVETSQYIKSHETVPTLQINYCTCKKRLLCAPMRESHIYWDSCLHLVHVWLLWQTSFVFFDLTWLNINVHLRRDWYTYMNIPHTIIRRSVVLQRISKPEINRPKLVKLILSTKYIQSKMTSMLLNRTQSWGKHCFVNSGRYDKLGGLQEETSKNDSGCQARQVSRSSIETILSFRKQHIGNLQFNDADGYE